MPSSTSYDFGDLVLVPFPFTDQTGAKNRPAVVVSSSTLHRESVDLIMAAVTTQPRSGSSLEMPIGDWGAAGLPRPSVVKPVLFTLDRKLVLKPLGRLSEGDRTALKTALLSMIG